MSKVATKQEFDRWKKIAHRLNKIFARDHFPKAVGSEEYLVRSVEEAIGEYENSTINNLAWIIINASSQGYVSSNDLDFANEALDELQAAEQRVKQTGYVASTSVGEKCFGCNEYDCRCADYAASSLR